MPIVTRKALVTVTVAVLGGVGVVVAGGLVWSGVYNIGADDPHWRPTYALLETVRERSIETRARTLQVPADLNDPTRIRLGAGNYNAMCTGCHLAPGAGETELSLGLYPAPPNLTKQLVDAGQAFWVIKHGIKASGMPAWGKSMDDDSIWNMAAFLQQLPKLDKARYDTLVASSGGHAHGGGETGAHTHADGGDDHHADGDADEPAADEDHGEAEHEAMSEAATETVPAAGKTHVHAAEPPAKPLTKAADDPRAGMTMPMPQTPPAAPANDGHPHQP
ncbi:cytochrome c [Xanthomonas euvesicatoria pv. allii]|uniref:c-type cytochrome n=1 Tax=Xanthomonas euvesicatoria TaxID=456327 RepID=UPI0024058C17|nr:cytochrome c [Xanthomonas euvesicatoria]MCP3050699.1 cytochrome c [Xanthomonas euvesicatoria pv. allii]